MMNRYLLVLFAILLSAGVYAQNEPVYVATQGTGRDFKLFGKGDVAHLLVDSADYKGVIIALNNLKTDIARVSGSETEILFDQDSKKNNLIIVGTIGKSKLIDQLIKTNKIDVSKVINTWESFVIQTVDKPMDGVNKALVIAGSDKRGTIYGIYDVSKQIGVSPWYYWADVPITQHEVLFVKKGRYVVESPAVKYRGIFINDEAPALRNWATEQFGGLNHKFYEKVFELLLRNRANYLWPAMWLPTMFNVDDPLNPKVADEYGIVVSTSHHEPLMRAHNEWYREGEGQWNYVTNKEKLTRFWRKGIERMGQYESVVTVGMRGDGDEAMAEETATDLLHNIIADQRKIIADVTGKPANQTPQVWAIYKEVQDYYDKGLRVDDDITILFSDDNWGNIRYLPKKNDLNRAGGFGMYYHFDYVGSPVSYKWLNTSQIERVWEQLKLTYEHGVKNIWIANVGDIKPMELPISFFFEYAWNPDAIQANDLPKYYDRWVTQQFGSHFTSQIAELLALYTKYNARRTPEMLSANTYSIENYREADRVVEEYNRLFEKSKTILSKLPSEYHWAYSHLVHTPIELCANLNEMYVAAAKNKYYGVRGASAANYYALRVKELFDKDAQITRLFHEKTANGKWNHMLSQTHIGYTFWNHPPLNMMPAVSYVQVDKPAKLGYFIENGIPPKWGWLDVEADWSFSTAMPMFDSINDQNYYIDIVNRGTEPFDFSIKTKQDWIKISKTEGNVEFHEKVYVSIDWTKAPKKRTSGEIVISGTGDEYSVSIPIRNDIEKAVGFVENNGVVAFDAGNYSRKFDTKNIRWISVPMLGRTGSSLIIEPVTTSLQKIDANTPYLEYDFTLFDANNITIDAYLSPTQDFRKQGGLKYAIAIDNETPLIINMNEGEEEPDYKYADWWIKSVGNHIKIKQSKHKIDKAGKHTLKIWMMDAGIVLQKFVIDAGGNKKSYLGAPQSIYVEP